LFFAANIHVGLWKVGLGFSMGLQGMVANALIGWMGFSTLSII
jgi:hypothetical protein